MWNTRRTWLLVAIILLAGCATPARVDQMTARPSAVIADKESHLKNRLGLGLIAGGEETNPLWVSNVANADFSRSLEDSLRVANLLATKREDSQYLLAANLNALQQPFLGLDMTVTASVSYTLTEASSGKEIFRTTVSTPYTATFSDAFLGVERLKMANEGAVRANITSIIEQLYALKPGSVSITSSKPKEARLSELKALYEKGLISKDNYAAEQQRILSE